MTYDVQLKGVSKAFSSGGKQVLAVDNIDLAIDQGEFFALLGPSGCGKTTTLRMIAGFEQPTEGEILLRGDAVQGVPPFHRPVNTVFQDYALFPHMTVLNNVMFGLKMDGRPNRDCRKLAEEALDLVRLPDVGDRKPTQLSGGQQQRVALARALAKRPAVLLLDEPLGALDLKLRKQMQYELKSMQQQVGITFIYVTHDQEEALTMADRIAVMSDGHVLQVGSPRDIYETPSRRFVADFIGETNFIEGDLIEQGDGVGQVRLGADIVIPAQMPPDKTVHNGPVTIPIRPERIGIVPTSEQAAIPSHRQMTTLTGKLTETQYIGTDMRYTVQIAGGNAVVVRTQNVDYEERYTFDIGHDVMVFWPLQSTVILDQ